MREWRLSSGRERGAEQLVVTRIEKKLWFDLVDWGLKRLRKLLEAGHGYLLRLVHVVTIKIYMI